MRTCSVDLDSIISGDSHMQLHGCTDAFAELRAALHERVKAQIDAFIKHPQFERFAVGQATRHEYDTLLCNIARTHIEAPRVLAFLSAMAPKGERNAVNELLTTLGVSHSALSHPELLEATLRAAGLGNELASLRAESRADLRSVVTEPLFSATLRDAGFAVLLETIAFELMLSRLASTLANFLERYRGLESARLTWFTHYSLADHAHVERALDAAVAYLEQHGFDCADAATLIDTTLKQNVFIKRYISVGAVSMR